MARIVAEESEPVFHQVIHSAGVRRFGEAQAWLSTTALSREAARTYDMMCERDKVRELNSSSEAKYSAALKKLRIVRNTLAQTLTELTQVKANHSVLKTYAVEATSRAVEFGIRAKFSEEEARVLGDRVDELEIQQLEEERKEPAHKAAEGLLGNLLNLLPTWLLRLVRA